MSTYDNNIEMFVPDVPLMREVERALEISLDWRSDTRAKTSLAHLAVSHGTSGIDILDYIVHRMGQQTLTTDLSSALTEAGSAWRVNADFTGLERRVEETVSEAAAVAMQHGKSGQLLREAWVAVYGVSPDPSKAYGQAIKAVEVAAHSLVTPNDAIATLGKMIGELRANPNKFTLSLAGKGDTASTGDTSAVTITRLMMQLLWTGQHDRHGNFDTTQPISVSQQEAEAAVHLAVLLVQWFETGIIAHS